MSKAPGSQRARSGRCSGNGFLTGPLALERRDAGGVGGGGLGGEVVRAGVASRSSSWSSICSSRRRLRSALGPYCSRRSLAICSFRCAMTASMALSRATALAARASASSARARAAVSSALSAPISSGRGETTAAMRESESFPAPPRKAIMGYPALAGRQLYCGLRQSMPLEQAGQLRGGERHHARPSPKARRNGPSPAVWRKATCRSRRAR